MGCAVQTRSGLARGAFGGIAFDGMAIAATPRTIVLVGAGPCSAAAAAGLRDRGYSGRLVMVGAEDELPYERPPLSKGYLLGEAEFDTLRVRSPEWFADHDVEVRVSTRVEALDPHTRRLQLSNGSSLRYDAVLVATGGRPIELPGPRSERIVHLRDRADADRLARHLEQGTELLIIGAGFVGCEVAAAARRRGTSVTVLTMEDQPLEAALGPRVGAILHEVHRGNGVTLRTGERVVDVADLGHAVRVRTNRGEYEAPLLLVAVGVRRNTEWLEGSGVACQDGVLVDSCCATGVPGVFAAGDVAAQRHPAFGGHVRVGHHDNAVKQGAAVAATMLGDTTEFNDPLWFWSDQYEHNLQSVGVARDHDEVVLRGSVEDRNFSVFYLRDGHVRSVFGFNRPGDVVVGRRMVLTRFVADREVLRDTSLDLRRTVNRALRAA